MSFRLTASLHVRSFRWGCSRPSVWLAPLVMLTAPLLATERSPRDGPGAGLQGEVALEFESAAGVPLFDNTWLEGDSYFGPSSTPTPAGI